MHFPEKDKIFLELQKLLPSPVKIVVGVSGGPDSRLAFAVLHDFYEQKGWNHELLIVAHYNHGQRKESTKEQEQIYKRYKYHHIYTNTDKPGKGKNETSLRLLRMSFFDEVCKKEGATYLATGHNLDDRIETSFMNILRGTSLTGLVNMTLCDFKDGHFILRPLLSLQKSYIQELCDVHTIPYFMDPTNKKSSLTIRNALRNDVFPQLSLLSPQNKWYDSRSLIYKQIERDHKKTTSDSIWLLGKTPHRRWGAKFFYEIALRGVQQIIGKYTEADWIFAFQKLGIYKNVSQKTLAEWVRFSNTNSDGYKFLAGVYFFISHGKIYAIKAPENFWGEESSLKLSVKKGATKISFDGTTLSILPEWQGGVIRYAKPGDLYRGKRVKKRMLNQKIPIFRRNYIPVVEKKGKIIDIINIYQQRY